MQKYYTAVGRFERKGRMGDMTCPMVIINNREYALDIQEMILWAALNWQIMDAGALEGCLFRQAESQRHQTPAQYLRLYAPTDAARTGGGGLRRNR